MSNLEKLTDDEFIREFRRGSEAHENDAFMGNPHGASFEYLCDLIREALIREMDMGQFGRVEH